MPSPQSNEEINISFNSEKSTGFTTKPCAPRSRAWLMLVGISVGGHDYGLNLGPGFFQGAEEFHAIHAPAY